MCAKISAKGPAPGTSCFGEGGREDRLGALRPRPALGPKVVYVGAFVEVYKICRKRPRHGWVFHSLPVDMHDVHVGVILGGVGREVNGELVDALRGRETKNGGMREKVR